MEERKNTTGVPGSKKHYINELRRENTCNDTGWSDEQTELIKDLDNRISTIDNKSGKFTLPVPDRIDNVDEHYFYFGWEDINGKWRIERQSRLTFKRENTYVGHSSLTDAWPNREILQYS